MTDLGLRKPRNIDDDFAEAMRIIGGKRPIEIDPSVEPGKNADLILLADNVVLELKTLMSDPMERRELSGKVDKLYAQWVNDGKQVPIIFGTGQINTMDIPPECAIELVRLLARPIRDAVRTANGQIRVTKA
jgi:hypothetical protein